MMRMRNICRHIRLCCPSSPNSPPSNSTAASKPARSWLSLAAAKQRHQLLLADRTRADAWITAVVEHLLAADPTVTLAEVETAFRDAAALSYVIAGRDKTFCVITGGMPAMLAALGEAGRRPEQNRQALTDRR